MASTTSHQPMRILEYIGLDTSAVAASYRKVTQALADGDFRAAQVKKLGGGGGHEKLYRARLDERNRLLFSLVRHGDEVCALMLEVILNHAYDKSRFLRGAVIDEAKIPDAKPTEARQDARALRYLNPEHAAIHLLDKPISFDAAQEAIYRQPPPLVVVGSAGSGKTALTLEKLKHAPGEVLYVTHSAFLAESARELYYGNGFEAEGQEVVFLSYREFVEAIHVPPGREAQWRDFNGWFARIRQAFAGVDAHQAFEEIRGVISSAAAGVPTRAGYGALGVRQSIFPPERRDTLYDLFEKYQAWLRDSSLFDLNLVAQDWLARAQPRYDFVVVDEVQDVTPIQLALVLRTLKKPGQFLLCGDSNQIVHPNFFSWAQVKTLFWSDPALAPQQSLRVLAANFRNGQRATELANTLLKVKHSRFGSIDRESNYLVNAVGGSAGAVSLMPDKEASTRLLNQQTRQSTRFAVLVMRDEDKAAARQHFNTPLLFSIHEAKGLEYENIVLYRFVSDHRAEFAEIASGVEKTDLARAELDYRRARDKSDKSLEVYKFYVNALYVALTRAIENLYLVESDTRHPLLDLLGLTEGAPMQVGAAQSSREDWQKEARKLDLQGKQEQADAIRQTILKEAPVPWPVFDQARCEELLVKVFREQAVGNKLKHQLLDIATCHDDPVYAGWLVQEAKFEAARNFTQVRAGQGRKSYATYYAHNFKEILRQCDRHGLEHRLPMNLTPLMAAAAAGNLALVDALLERGADREAVDHFGQNALHWAMREAFGDRRFAQGPFGALYERLAPASVDVNTGERLVRIDRHLAEYFLFQTLWTLFKSRFTRPTRPQATFDTQAILQAWEHLPARVVPPQRNQRQALSNLLSRNEVARDYAYNRRLFWRATQGQYQFNPKLSVRRRHGGNESWVPIFQALNLAFVHQGAHETQWPALDFYLAEAGLPKVDLPIAAERPLARHREAQAQRERQAKAERAALERQLAESRRVIRLQEEVERAARKQRLAADRRMAGSGRAAKTFNISGVRRAADTQRDAPAHSRSGAPMSPLSAALPPPDPLQATPEPNHASPAVQSPARPDDTPAPWGTPAARRQEIERVRREIEQRRRDREQ